MSYRLRARSASTSFDGGAGARQWLRRRLPDWQGVTIPGLVIGLGV